MTRGTGHAESPPYAARPGGVGVTIPPRELVQLDPVRLAHELARQYPERVITAFKDATKLRDDEAKWWEGCDEVALRAPTARPRSGGDVTFSFSRWDHAGQRSRFWYRNTASFDVTVEDLIEMAQSFDARTPAALPARRPYLSFEEGVDA